MPQHLSVAARRTLGGLFALVVALAWLVAVDGAQPAHATWSPPTVTYVGSTTGFSSGGSTLTVSAAVPGAAQAGDTLIVTVTAERDLIPTLSGVSGLTSVQSANSSMAVQTSYKTLAAADLGGTVTATVTIGRRMAIVAAVYRGVGSVTATTAGAVNAPAATVGSPAATPVRDNSVLVGIVNYVTSGPNGAPYTTNFTVASPYTERAETISTHPSAINAVALLADRTLSGGAGASQSGMTATGTHSGGRYFGSTIVLGPRTEREYRESLTPGVHEPTADHTGVLPDVALSPTTPAGGLLTLGNNALLENADVFGRIRVTGSNVTIRNVRVRGSSSSFGPLIQAWDSGVSNLVIEHVTLAPDTPDLRWGSGIHGHDFTVRFADISRTIDGINVAGKKAAGYVTNVTIKQNYIHDLAWWTAENTNVVNPSDTESHNDAIQHHTGSGTVILGNSLHAAYAREYAHWHVQNWGIDPDVNHYVSVPLNSLPDGGPWHQLVPNRGSGIASNGRYNVDDLCNLMIGDEGEGEASPSNNLNVTDNWLYGGNYSVNGGGNAYVAGYHLGSFLRNKFDRTQGDQSSGGDNTQTLNFGFNNWNGHVTAGAGTADANTYLDNGHEVNVRGD
jgi:hypothetical protein